MALSRDDRITAAGIQGVVEGHVAGIGDRAANHQQLLAELAAGDGPVLAAALAEIRGRLPDDAKRAQAVLDESAARYTKPNGSRTAEKLRLLVLAGADPDQAARIQAGRRGGWRTPQAKAWNEP